MATKKTAAKKAAKKTAPRKEKAAIVGKMIHVFPDVEIVEGSQFTEGVPTKINVSLAYKMETRKWENMTVQASLSLDLKKGADVTVAVDQAFNFVGSELGERVRKIRKKYSGNQSEGNEDD